MKNRQRGFTLVELLVVIAIIGLLSTIGVVSLNSARAKARDAKRLSDVRQMSSILELFFNGKQSYPQSPLAGTKMDGGCIDESAGVRASGTACVAPVILTLSPTAPPTPANQYDYFGYSGAVPAAGAGAGCVTGSTTPCQSYGIQFTLETTVSGVGNGQKCFSASGILDSGAGNKVCPAATS